MISQQEEIINLASELLADIELHRISSESIVFKSSRLARLIGSEAHINWLKCETSGYKIFDEFEVSYIHLTNRCIDAEKGTGYYQPLAVIEALIDSKKIELQNTRVPDLSFSNASTTPNFGNPIWGTLKQITERQSTLSGVIVNLEKIRTSTLGLIYEFVTTVYNEKMFSSLAESVFENFKSRIDTKLSEFSNDLLQKIPSIYNRLNEADDPEAISQALTTCRRLIEHFADKAYPSPGASITIDGEKIEVGPEKTKNRLYAYTKTKCLSSSRRERLKNTLTDLWKRLSGGVHSDITFDEARVLFVLTYTYLGELLTLEDKSELMVNRDIKTG